MDRASARTIMLALAIGCGSQAIAAPGPSFTDHPECDPDTPTAECAARLFVAVDKAVLPFDGVSVKAAMQGMGFQIADGWRATALHHYVTEAPGRTSCFFNDYRVGEAMAPFSASDCGTFLFVGGHPRALTCRSSDVLVENCTLQVPLEQSFDVVAHQNDISGPSLPIAPIDSVKVGDSVYLVGNPFFGHLPEMERATLEADWPSVTGGTVVAVSGRSIVSTNLGMFGNSGGPLLNSKGEAIGVFYARVEDLRGFGTEVDPNLGGKLGVSTGFDQQLVNAIESAR